ncbi:NUC185 domain-containing protein [Cokeromyces recurvatus]|uniref:NUC185 domain-containing protein n=1 Tax=Cokeromyces recurvatus TaxID=90255 RepID=UPI00221EDC53|nr:NUC185 domain-containing protein [Cokeromyces recurvatus]KAI7903508.1 NUC185 domain-containing protein [Cokeromyces recurvatus]
MEVKINSQALEEIFSRLRNSDEQTPSVAKETVQDIKNELEHTFLTPKQSFPDSWLSKCQEHWKETPEYASHGYSQLSKARTKIEVVRKGFDGDIIGFKEDILDDPNSTCNNSTSFSRAFGSTKDFVRGSASQFPFAPGGLEAEIIEDDIVNEVELDTNIDFFDNEEANHLMMEAPGLDRGLVFQKETEEKTESEIPRKEAIVFSIEDMMAPIDDKFDFLNVKVAPIDEVAEELPEKENFENGKDNQEVDELLPANILPQKDLIPKKLNKMPHEAIKRVEWAHEINVNEPFDNFYDLVPEMAMEFPFELDIFQKQAVYHLEMGDSVFIAAHTSAGKTVVADYAIALATKHMTKAIYTSPIKALSNQKFRDFKRTFGEDVGILTGDVQIRPEASCLVMTTEILRSMLYRGADLIRDVEFVIFDEVHYVNDLERGVVWEEVIIMLPAHVNIILLSATVPNTKEFAGWVGRTKKKDIYVISTLKRPVPLEHYIYANKDIYKIVGANENKLNMVGYNKAKDAMLKRKEQIDKANRVSPNARGGRGGRGGSVARGGNRSVGRSYQAAMQTDRNLFVHLIGMLKTKSLLPVVIFTFSKKRCEEYASGLTKTDLCTSLEKSEIHVFIERSLVRLRGSDKYLPQILRMRDLLSRGIAVHHGGLLPIIKEMVEILFARGLVKVLFATETFAMGVNMPARSVVFSSIRKHDGRNFRDLLPGEYTQMSGRAGRRGLDNTGVVILATGGDEPPEISCLSTMILGKPTKLESQFRLTYNMILNLLRVEALKVEEMIKRSFSENSAQKLLPETKRLVDESEQKRSALRQLDCAICEPDLEKFYDMSGEVIFLTRNMMTQFISNTPTGNRALSTGRLIVVNTNIYRNVPAMILKPLPISTANSQHRSFYCLILSSKDFDNNSSLNLDESVPLPITTICASDSGEGKTSIITVGAPDILFISRLTVKIDVDAIMAGTDSVEAVNARQQLEAFGLDAKRSGIVEFDFGKIKDMEFQEMSRSRNSLIKRLRTEFQCTKCPEFNEHYGLIHDHKKLSSQIEMLKMTISDQNLELLPDYHQRIEVLRQLNYIDDQGTVQLKGRVACEINSADELLLTELVLDNVFADYEPAEVVALLSCFVFQERNASEPRLTPKLVKGKEVILAYARKIAELQVECGLPISVEDYVSGLKFGLVEVVYEWARGLSFKSITDLTDVLEGSIVRCISRLDETCREVMGAARMVGDTSLYKKMEQAEQDIKRDIVFAASLYF